MAIVDTKNNTPEVTPENIRELLENATDGEWGFIAPIIVYGYHRDMGGFFSTKEDGNKTIICHFGDSQTYYPTEGEIPNNGDIELIKSTPAIARTYLKMHEENTRLRAALERITKHQHCNPGNTGELKIIASEALKEQPK